MISIPSGTTPKWGPGGVLPFSGAGGKNETKRPWALFAENGCQRHLHGNKMRLPAQSSLVPLCLELCSPSHIHITFWHERRQNEVVTGFHSGPIISAPKKITKIREYPSFCGNNFTANPAVSSQMLHNLAQHCGPGPFRQWESPPPEIRLKSRWLVVSRHCLGAAFDWEWRAHDILFPHLSLEVQNCHLTARKKNYGTSGLIGRHCKLGRPPTPWV